MSSETIQITVKDQIETDFKDYAMYVLQLRGIPNFYDGLTPSQRLGLLHAPDRLEATVALIGRIMQTGLYHHGDMSLSQSLARNARKFLCSEPLLEGDGFFGTPIKTRAASSRYTKIKAKQSIKSVLTEYNVLNERNEEGGFDWLHTTLPVGMALHTVGIAVGYSSIILPRKLSDIKEYLEGKPKRLTPFFLGYSGKISKAENLNGKSAWLLESVLTVNQKDMTITIESLPPLMKYESFIAKLTESLGSYNLPHKILNESKTEVKIIVVWKDKSTFSEIQDLVERHSRMGVVETVVFVRDGAIVEYNDFKDYLDDFKIHVEVVKLKKLTWDIEYDKSEIDFLKAKIQFMEFMLVKKRIAKEIQEFLSNWKGKIKARLESIRLVHLSKEELEDTKLLLAQMEAALIKKLDSLKIEKIRVTKLQKAYKSAASTHVGSGGDFLADLDFGEVYRPDESDDTELVQEEDEND